MVKLIYPCDSRRITSEYGPRDLGDGFHDGVDFGAIAQGVDGDNIYATHDGKVAMAYFSSSYGNCIIINGDGFSTLYAHLSVRNVKDGQFVKQGQLIGHMGNTGNSSGTHLHFEYRTQIYASDYFRAVNGKFVSSIDPLPLLHEKEEILYPGVPEWALEAWQWSVKEGLNDGVVQDNTEIQTVVMLYRYHQKFNQ